MGSLLAAAATRARPPTQYWVRPTSASQRPGLPQSLRHWMPWEARAAAAAETLVMVGGGRVCLLFSSILDQRGARSELTSDQLTHCNNPLAPQEPQLTSGRLCYLAASGEQLGGLRL